jgi:hypothetical protein
MPARRLFAALLAVIAATCATAETGGGAQVKARVALAIARFAEIPGRAASMPLRLCLAVRGAPPRPLLDLAGEKVGTHGVEVRVGPPSNACDVIYLDETFARWQQFIAVTAPPVLTVGDVPGFLAAGGMIELVIENDAVRFDVNLRALRDRNIRLPAQVLKLARQVKEQ